VIQLRYGYQYDHAQLDKLTRRLKKALMKHMAVFGKRASGKGDIGLQRHLERGGGYASNSPIWRKGKGGRRVFYDTGFWRRQPSFKIDPAVGDELVSVQVGFLSDEAHPAERSSIGTQGLAQFLAEGGSWTPSKRQRRAMWAGLRRRGVRPKPGEVTPKSQYTVPARDFIEKHLKSPEVLAAYHKAFDKANQEALKTCPRKKVKAG